MMVQQIKQDLCELHLVLLFAFNNGFMSARLDVKSSL